MGVFSLPILHSLDDLKGINENESKSSGVLWKRVLKRKSNGGQQMMRCRRVRLMKRRRGQQGNNEVERKVKTLKKLVPKSESRGIEGLFRETADYILALEMKIKVMQVMVKVLTGSSDDE